MLGALLLSASSVSAQSYAIVGAEKYFRVESEAVQGRRGPVVSGYVYNAYGYSGDRTRLLIEGLDASGQVVSSTIGYVLGTIPPGGSRAYLTGSAPRAGPHVNRFP